MSARPVKNILLPPMLYFQKPKLGPLGRSVGGSSSVNTSKNPLQVAFPSGGFGLGLPNSQTHRPEAHAEDSDEVFVASEPENFDIDILERRYIIYSFIALGMVNLIITSVMYNSASTFNSSNVVPAKLPDMPMDDDAPFLGAHFMFQEVPLERRPIESTYYTFLILATILGMLSALVESPLGLSAYALTVPLNFLLGTSALPYFLFSLRYVFDLWMLYAALVLRSKLCMNFLNMHVHRT